MQQQKDTEEEAARMRHIGESNQFVSAEQPVLCISMPK